MSDSGNSLRITFLKNKAFFKQNYLSLKYYSVQTKTKLITKEFTEGDRKTLKRFLVVYPQIKVIDYPIYDVGRRKRKKVPSNFFPEDQPEPNEKCYQIIWKINKKLKKEHRIIELKEDEKVEDVEYPDLASTVRLPIFYINWRINNRRVISEVTNVEGDVITIFYDDKSYNLDISRIPYYKHETLIHISDNIIFSDENFSLEKR